MNFIRRHLLLAAFIVSLILNFSIYGNTLTGEFVLDDRGYVGRKELYKPSAIVSIWGERGQPYSPNTSGYRPLSTLTWVLTFNLFGANVVPFHITNILLHSFVTFLLFVIVRKMFASDGLAVFSALLFTVLPIHTENVANIKGRDDIIAALFVLLGTFFLQKSIRQGGKINLRWLLGSYFSFLLALFSKELSIFMIGWYLVLFKLKTKVSVGRTIVVGIGYALAIVVLLVVRSEIYRELSFQGNIAGEYVFNPLSEANFSTRVWTNTKIIAMYIIKTFIPYNLSAGYQYNHLTLVDNPFTSGLSIVGVGFITLIFFILLKKRPYKSPLSIGLIFFLFAFLPLPKIFFLPLDIFAERWMYLPSVGLCLIVGFVLMKLYKRISRISLVLFLLLLITYSFVTIERNKAWQTWSGFLEQFVRDAPNNVFAHTVLVGYYAQTGDIRRAKEEAAAAYSIYPKYQRLRRVAGKIAAKEEKYEQAFKLLYDYPQLHPYFTEEHFLYAQILYEIKKYQECISYITERYGASPPTEELSFILGMCYLKVGDTESAFRYIIHDEKLNIYRPRK